jgi:hypothetical protein
VGEHGIDDSVIAQLGILQAEHCVLLFTTAQQGAWTDAQQSQGIQELFTCWRGLEVFDDEKLLATFADKFERLPRLAAAWIVVDGGAHWDKFLEK